MVKTDCFAYATLPNGVAACGALNALYCKSEDCKFYKNKDEVCKECHFQDCGGCAKYLVREHV